MSENRLPVNYVHADGVPAFEMQDGWIPPAVGQGVVNEGGERFRIVDVWVNYEKHGGGPGGYGVYAFIEPARGDDDRLGRLYSYYND